MRCQRRSFTLTCSTKLAHEDKALQASPTGISVSVENRGTDGQVRSEQTSVFVCVDGQEDKLSIFGEDGSFVGGRPARRLRIYKAVFFQRNWGKGYPSEEQLSLLGDEPRPLVTRWPRVSLCPHSPKGTHSLALAGRGRRRPALCSGHPRPLGHASSPRCCAQPPLTPSSHAVAKTSIVLL